MPQIVNHEAPWVHALAGLAQSASETGDAINDERRLSALLEAAKQRLAMERSGEVRAQGDYDYRMGRAKVEDQQRDSIYDLKKRGLEQDVQTGELDLEKKQRAANYATNGQGPLAAQDPYLDADLQEFRTHADQLLEGTQDVPMEGEFARRAIDDMLGTIRNYGTEEEDPQRRSQLRRGLAARLLEQAKIVTKPARKLRTQTTIGLAKSRNTLANNEQAQAALPILEQQLNDPNVDPDEVMGQFRKLQYGVAGDSKALARQQIAHDQIGEFMRMTVGDSNKMLQLSDLQQEVAHDLIEPEAALTAAKKIMYGDETSDEEWAMERALRGAGTGATKEDIQTRYDMLLEARMKSARRGRREQGRTPFAGVASPLDSQFAGAGGSSAATSSQAPASPADSQVGRAGPSAAQGPQAPASPSDSQFGAAGASAAFAPNDGLTGVAAEANVMYKKLRAEGKSHEEAQMEVFHWAQIRGVNPLGPAPVIEQPKPKLPKPEELSPGARRNYTGPF